MIPRVEATIIDLLKQQNTAIIPKLGTVSKGGENGTHKFEYNAEIEDNAILENLLIEFPGNADALLKQYVEAIKASLTSSGSYMINGVGRIIRDKNGVVHFISAMAQPQEKVSLVRPATVASEPAAKAPVEKKEESAKTEVAAAPLKAVEPEKPAAIVEVKASPKAQESASGKPLLSAILSILFILLSIAALGYKVVILHGGQAHHATEDELHLQPATNQEIHLIQKEINKEEDATMHAHSANHAEAAQVEEETSPAEEVENAPVSTLVEEVVEEARKVEAITEAPKTVAAPAKAKKEVIATPTSGISEEQLVDINHSNRSIIIVEPCYTSNDVSKKFVEGLSNRSVNPEDSKGLSCITLYKAGEWGKSKAEMQKLKSQIESGAFMYVF